MVNSKAGESNRYGKLGLAPFTDLLVSNWSTEDLGAIDLALGTRLSGCTTEHLDFRF